MSTEAERWPQATNYAEAERLSRLYRSALSDLEKGGIPAVGDQIGYRRYDILQRHLTLILQLAQLHATLANVDVMRSTLELERYRGR